LVAASSFEAKSPNPHHHQQNAAIEARVCNPQSSSAILRPRQHFSQGYFFVKICNTLALAAYQTKWM
jgi:hypothetical protein